jgi:hypothetical protein
VAVVVSRRQILVVLVVEVVLDQVLPELPVKDTLVGSAAPPVLIDQVVVAADLPRPGGTPRQTPLKAETMEEMVVMDCIRPSRMGDVMQAVVAALVFVVDMVVAVVVVTVVAIGTVSRTRDLPTPEAVAVAEAKTWVSALVLEVAGQVLLSFKCRFQRPLRRPQVVHPSLQMPLIGGTSLLVLDQLLGIKSWHTLQN